MTIGNTVGVPLSNSGAPEVVTIWGVTLPHVAVCIVGPIGDHPGSSFENVA